MLQITIPSGEIFDERTNEFITIKGQTISLEHSLVSISKWESKWNKPFLSKDKKTVEEELDYIKCMTLTQNVDPNIYRNIDNLTMSKINAYMELPMTATTFRKSNCAPSREIITSEIIYYQMISNNIPMECQKWHFSRLMTLIRVCNEKSGPKKKMSSREIYEQNQALNASRRARNHSKG